MKPMFKSFFEHSFQFISNRFPVHFLWQSHKISNCIRWIMYAQIVCFFSHFSYFHFIWTIVGNAIWRNFWSRSILDLFMAIFLCLKNMLINSCTHSLSNVYNTHVIWIRSVVCNKAKLVTTNLWVCILVSISYNFVIRFFFVFVKHAYHL